MYQITASSKGKILIVEDDAASISLLRSALDEVGDVFVTTTGMRAIQVGEEVVPDIVILDLMLPDTTGFEVCKRLKRIPALKDTPVVFLTSHGDMEFEVAALEAGGADFLRKPLNVPIIQARVRTHLALRARTRELTEARRDLKELVERLPAFIAVWNDQLQNIYCNDQRGEWFGVEPAKILGRTATEVFGELNSHIIEENLMLALKGDNVFFDLEVARSSSSRAFVKVSLISRPTEADGPTVLMLMTDVTALTQMLRALHDQKEWLRVTLNSIGDAVIATDTSGQITFINPIAEQMTGWISAEAIGRRIEVIMPLHEGEGGRELPNPIRWALHERRVVGMAFNSVIRRRDGRSFYVEDSAAPILDEHGETVGAIIVFHDVSEARAMALKMSYLANHDPLTNLPNRLLLQDRGEQALRLASQAPGLVALLMLDIDGFKQTNNIYGFATADTLLQQVGHRIVNAVPSGTTVSRQGGDEFVILVPDAEDIANVSVIAEHILSAFNQAYVVDQTTITMTASIGIALYPDDSENWESLLRHADIAMYRSKQDGGARASFFSADIEDTVRRKAALQRALKAAITDNQFELFYQPKIDFATQRVAGAEALVRWRQSDGNYVSPAEFIPIADETGLIVPLGRQVMEMACKQLKQWHDLGHKIRLAVNVSPFSSRNSILWTM